MGRVNPAVGGYKILEEQMNPKEQTTPEETEARANRELVADAVNSLGLYSTNSAFVEPRTSQNRFNFASGIMDGPIVNKKYSWVSSIGAMTIIKSKTTVKNTAVFNNFTFRVYPDSAVDDVLVDIQDATAMFINCVFHKLDNQTSDTFINVTGSNAKALFTNCLFVGPSGSNGKPVITNSNTAAEVILASCVNDTNDRLIGTVTNNGSFLT